MEPDKADLLIIESYENKLRNQSAAIKILSSFCTFFAQNNFANMNQKFTLKVLFLFTLLFFGGCSGCCDESIEILIEASDVHGVHLNNSGEFPELSSSNVIPAEAYVLGAYFDLQDYLVMTNEFNHFNLGQKAFALSCLEEYRMIHDISHWDIRSLYDFDADHPAGTLLNDYFVVYNSLDLSSSVWSYQSDTVQFALFATPDSSRQQFVLDIYFENDSLLRDTTGVVWLN